MFPALDAGPGSIDLAIEEHLARIRINWPNKRNALRFAMLSEIPRVMEVVQHDPSVSVVVITGTGERAFAAGADIRELEACLGSPEKASAYLAAGEAAMEAIVSCPLPVIAAIRGYCIGAGLEIAMACDFRLATSLSVFGAPPAKLGANYSFGSTKRLVDLVGPGVARKILFTGAQLSADEALSTGLIDYRGIDIDSELNRIVDVIHANSPYSISVAKRTLNEIANGAVTESDAIKTLRLRGFANSDLREGIAAFLEKRPPRFRRPPG
jgi:enoyl-CoA hydratase/carnithine racemase